MSSFKTIASGAELRREFVFLGREDSFSTAGYDALFKHLSECGDPIVCEPDAIDRKYAEYDDAIVACETLGLDNEVEYDDFEYGDFEFDIEDDDFDYENAAAESLVDHGIFIQFVGGVIAARQ